MIDRAGRCGEERRNWCRTWPAKKGADRLAGLHAPRLSGSGENQSRAGLALYQRWFGHLAPRIGEERTGDDGVSRARVVAACRKGWGWGERKEEEEELEGNWARIGRGRRPTWGPTVAAPRGEEDVPKGGAYRNLIPITLRLGGLCARYYRWPTRSWTQRPHPPGPQGPGPLASKITMNRLATLDVPFTRPFFLTSF